MTRLSKQFRRRMVSPKRPPAPGKKTGPKKDNLKIGFKEHVNAAAEPLFFIPKVKSV